LVAKARNLFIRIFSNIFDKDGSRLIGRYDVTFWGGFFGFGINIKFVNF